VLASCCASYKAIHETRNSVMGCQNQYPMLCRYLTRGQPIYTTGGGYYATVNENANQDCSIIVFIVAIVHWLCYYFRRSGFRELVEVYLHCIHVRCLLNHASLCVSDNVTGNIHVNAHIHAARRRPEVEDSRFRGTRQQSIGRPRIDFESIDVIDQHSMFDDCRTPVDCR
jgi:hypothetical protein